MKSASVKLQLFPTLFEHIEKCKCSPSVIWAIPPVRLGLSRRNSGKTPETLSERFLEFPSRVRLGCPKHYDSRHLRLPERFQNSLPTSTAGDASFFRIGSGEGLSELVMEFPAVLRVSLIHGAASLVVERAHLGALLGNGWNTVLRALLRKRGLTQFCGKLGEFCQKLGEFAFGTQIKG